jgi:tetratricopeptide (TPR) repeat protein
MYAHGAPTGTGVGTLALNEDVLRERLTQVFARQDFYEACKRRDAGSMVRILMSHGVTQGQLVSLTGLPQVTLSRYATGKNKAQYASTFEAFADGLSMPLRLRQALGLTGDTSPAKTGQGGSVGLVAGMPTDTFDLVQLAEAVGRNGSNVKRREMLSMAATLGATAAIAHSEAWERLAYALTNQTAINEATVKEMEARTAGFHLLEEMVSAPALLRGLTIQLREVSTLLGGTTSDGKDPFRTRLLVTAGESAVLAGWTASDVGDSGAARNWYDTAVKAAKEANDPGIAACALAYRSYIPATRGANGRARALLTEALEMLPSDQGSPGTIAWISARHAEESAQLGDTRQALNSWRRAEEAYSVADPEEDRVWTRFLDRNRFDSYRIATYSRIGRLDEAQETAARVLARLRQPDRKKAAIIFEDMAQAHLAQGSVIEASKLARAGITVLRETEFAMWLPRYATIAQALRQHDRKPAVRAYLEEFGATRRQFASQP